ncbi:MerR family transcriptional regulator [Hahella ganghwensis]|uniref:MerR family transcriptional regulator n=1 Tax=Hahella ganghwensis TaxID=286420 RepID=UPI000376F9E8|nr:MerR family transcriptional regulator [Hahella ganghwensis]
MYIGKVSQLTGASPKAIRHYENLGLLPGTKRRGSYRVYGNQEVQMIRLIRQAQTLGFKLSEMSAVMNHNSAIPSWQQIKCIIDAKIQQVEEEILQLQMRRQQLLKYADDIDSCLQNDPECASYPDPTYRS